MRDRFAGEREVENQRKQTKTWGIEAEEESLGDLLRFFFGMAIFLTLAGVVAVHALNALRAAGVL